MLRGDVIVAEELFLLALDDRGDVGGGELDKSMFGFSFLQLRVFFSLALLIVIVSFLELAIDGQLLLLYIIILNLFIPLYFNRGTIL